MGQAEVCARTEPMKVLLLRGKTYNFNQLWDGDLELHGDGVRDILHRPDELVVSSEKLPEQTVLCLGWEAVWGLRSRKGKEHQEK